MLHKKLFSRIGLGIEEFLLFTLIILNILDFIELLSPSWDFIKKIVSWTCLGYLFYKADLNDVFFGIKNKRLDLFVVIAFFLLITKQFVGFAKVAVEEASPFMVGFYELILRNAASIELYTLYLGLFMLSGIALYIVLAGIRVKRPSVITTIFKETKKIGIETKIIKFIFCFVIYIAFFVIIFNLAMEWLAIAIDAPLVIVGVFFYLFFIVKHARTADPETILFKLGNFGEEFYRRFINLLHREKTIFFAISGMLVLHLLVDFFNFIVPYLTGMQDILYFNQLGPGHTALIKFFIEDVSYFGSIITKSMVTIIYFMNICAVFLLLLGPAYLWYKVFKRSKIRLDPNKLGLFVASLACFFVSPLFQIKKITVPNLVGVDITTQSLPKIQFIYFITNMCVLIWLLVFFISLNKTVRKILTIGLVVSIEAFFMYYVYLYFTNILDFYYSLVLNLLASSSFMLAAYFILFLGINILFYISGVFIFLYEVWTGVIRKIR